MQGPCLQLYIILPHIMSEKVLNFVLGRLWWLYWNHFIVPVSSSVSLTISRNRKLTPFSSSSFPHITAFVVTVFSLELKVCFFVIPIMFDFWDLHGTSQLSLLYENNFSFVFSLPGLTLLIFQPLKKIKLSSYCFSLDAI